MKNKSLVANKEFTYLQSIKQSIIIPFIKINSKTTLINTKPHYTEAKLIQLLEEHGIGRPSTFSSLVEKVQEREYVKKINVEGMKIECIDYELNDDTISETKTVREFGNEKRKLVIQPLGIIIISFLNRNFSDLFHYDYTKNMEDELDKIANNISGYDYASVCRNCLCQVEKLIDFLKNNQNEKKHEIKIDEDNSYIIGKHGPVIKCVTHDENGTKNTMFKSVKEGIDINKLEKGEYVLEDIVDANDKKQIKINDSLGKYQEHNLYLKKGKYGLYASWGTNTKSLARFGNRPIENITYEDVIQVLNEESNVSYANNADDGKSKYKNYRYKNKRK